MPPGPRSPHESMKTKRHLPLFLVPLLAWSNAGCQQLQPPPPEEFGLWSDVSAGVDDRNLARLCEQVWEDDLRNDPFEATRLGDPRYNDRVPSMGVHRRRQRSETWSELLLAARGIRPEGLSARDQLTLGLLKQKLEDDLAMAKLQNMCQAADQIN